MSLTEVVHKFATMYLQLETSELRQLHQQILEFPIKQESIAALVYAVHEPSTVPEAIPVFLRLLTTLHDPLLVDHLLPFITHPNLRVRIHAIALLKKMPDRRSIMPLIDLWRENINEYARGSDAYQLTIEAWGQAGFTLAKMSEYSVDPLLGCLHDKNVNVRDRACFALSQIASPQTLESLLPLLHDQSPSVRTEAAYALEKIGSRSVIPELLAIRDDSDQDVRARVIFALGTLGYEDIFAGLHDSSANVRVAAVSVIGRYFPHYIQQYLPAMLTDSDSHVAETAAYYLSQPKTSLP